MNKNKNSLNKIKNKSKQKIINLINKKASSPFLFLFFIIL